VQEFWGHYSNIIDTKAFPDGSTLFLFKEGIKPLWEDFENMNGGKYSVTVQKAISCSIWSDLVYAAIGEQLDSDEHPQICGIVLSTRSRGNSLSIWVKNAPDPDSLVKADVETVAQGFRMVGSPASPPATYSSPFSTTPSLHPPPLSLVILILYSLVVRFISTSTILP